MTADGATGETPVPNLCCARICRLSRGGGMPTVEVWMTPAFADRFDVSTLSATPL